MMVSTIAKWIAENKEWLFSGLGIAIFTFVYGLIRWWIRKIKTPINDINNQNFLVNIEKAIIKYHSRDSYPAQINFTLTAVDDTHTIKRIWLKGKSFRLPGENQGCLYSDTGLLIDKLLPYAEQDLLVKDISKFDQYADYLFSQAYTTRNTKIERGQTISTSIIDSLQPPRLQDGWEEMDIHGWQLVIEYGHNHVTKIQFSFTIHETSPKTCTKWIYSGFSGNTVAENQ